MEIRVSASSAPNGSSSTSSRGSRASARASDTRCASPPDSVSGQASARSVEPDLVERPPGDASWGRRPAGRARRWRVTRFHGTSRASWKATATAPARRPRSGLALDVGVQAGERAQQRRLAGAAAPDQGDELAGRSPVRGRPGPCGPPNARRSPRMRDRWLGGAGLPLGASLTALMPAPQSGVRQPERAPLEQPHDPVGEQAEDRVDEQRDEDHVVLVELLALVDDEAEAGVGVDLLGDDEREPRDAERLAQADERLGQRAGQDDRG